MRLSILQSLLVLLCVALSAGAAEQGGGSAGLACLQQLELRRYAVQNQVPEGGKVDVRVLLKDDRKPASVHIKSSNKCLSREVEFQFRNRAIYARGCGGRSVELSFVFRLEGAGVARPSPTVTFQPRNRFIITSQPVKSFPDYLTEPRERKP